MIKRPFLILGVASFLSAFIASFFSLWIMIVAALTAAVGALFAWLLRAKKGMTTVSLACIGVLLASGVYALEEWTVVRPALALDGTIAYAVMRVEEQTGENGYKVAVESGDLPQGLRMYLQINDYTVNATRGDVYVGEVVLSAAYTEESPYGEQQAKASGVYLYAETSGDPFLWYDKQSERPWWDRALYGGREALHKSLFEHLDASDAALCENMTVGSGTILDETTQTAFRRCGVYHLLVVSGLHVSLLTGAVLALLKACRVHRLVRMIAAMVTAVLFAAFCGFSMSVVRAMWMMLITLFAGLVHRRGDGLNSVGLAALVMVCVDPFCVADIGWQLSFAATIGMVGLLPVWTRDVTARIAQRWPRFERLTVPVLTTVGASLCATLVTQPLTAFYFGELSLVFLPANLLCVPVASLLLVLCFAAVTIGGVIPPIADALYVVIAWLCDGVFGYTAWLSSVPWSSIIVCTPPLLLWLFALPFAVITAYRVQKMQGILRVTALMLCVVFVAQTAFLWMSNGVTTVAFARSSSLTALVKTDRGCGLLCTENEESLAAIPSLLRREDVSSLAFVVVFPDENTEKPLAWPSIPVDHVVLTAPKRSYASLPIAARFSTLSDGEALRFGAQSALEREGESYRLRIGNTSMLLVSKACDAAALPDAWKTVDVLLLRGSAPQNADALTADQVVVYTVPIASYRLRDTLPHRFGTLWLPSCYKAPVFLTRGSHDLILRTY